MSRLLFVIKTLAMGGGGAERVLASIAGALAARGHAVTVASFDPPRSEDFYACAAGVERVRLGRSTQERPTSLAEVAAKRALLRRLLSANCPEVAIGFMYSAYVPLTLAAPRAIPVIASEHGSHRQYQGHPIQQGAIALAASLSEALTIPSVSARATFPAMLARRMTVISNPVDFTPVEPTRGESARRRLLCVGRLRREKNHDLLIEAFARIAPERPEWNLVLVGDGPMQPALEQQAQRLGIAPRVSFAGAVHDVAREYAAADVFVLPSTTESFGLAAAEALRAGLPVVGFAECPALGEIVTSGSNGLLASEGPRVDGLATAIARVIDDPTLRQRLGDAGPLSVERFVLEPVVDRWEALIAKVLKKDRP